MSSAPASSPQIEHFEGDAARARLLLVLQLAVRSRIWDEVELAQTPHRIPFCGPPSGMELPLAVAGLRLQETAALTGKAYHLPYYRSGPDLHALGMEGGIFPQSIGIDGPFGVRNMTRHPQTPMVDPKTGAPVPEGESPRVEVLNVSTVLAEHLPIAAGLVAGSRIPDELRASRPDCTDRITQQGGYVTHVVLGDSTVPKADALEALLDMRTQHARLGKAPVVVTILDNGRGISTGAEYQVPGGSKGIPPLLEGMGYEVFSIDGTDYEAVEAAYAKAFQAALEGRPVCVHAKVTQPHGHASSGSPFLQQPRAAMRGHLEDDPVGKILKLGIERGVITPDEARALIRRTREEAKVAFDKAWGDFVRPIQEVARRAADLLEAAKADFPEQAELIDPSVVELRQSAGMYRVVTHHQGWVLGHLRAFLTATRRGRRNQAAPTQSRTGIVALCREIEQGQKKRLDSHVWAPTPVSPLNAPFVPIEREGGEDIMNSVLAAYFCARAARTPNFVSFGQDCGYPTGGPVREFLGMHGRSQVEIQNMKGPWDLIRRFIKQAYDADKAQCLAALFKGKESEIQSFLAEAYPSEEKRAAFLEDCFGKGTDILLQLKGRFFDFDEKRAENYDHLMQLIFGETPDNEFGTTAIAAMERLFPDAETGFASFARQERAKFWAGEPMLDRAVTTEHGVGAPACDSEGIKEAVIAGKAFGLALAGNTVVAEFQFLDFIEAAIPMLVTRIAPLRYLSAGHQGLAGNGQGSLLMIVNGDPRLGPWHSNNRIAQLLTGTPGLRIIFPRDGAHAAMLYEAALRSGDPTLAIQSLPRLRSKEKIPINLGEACMPFGRSELIFSPLIDSADADVEISQDDRVKARRAKNRFPVTVVTYGGNACVQAKEAGHAFLGETNEDQAVAVQVIDLQCLDRDSRDRNGKALMAILHSGHVLFADDDMAGGAASIICEDFLQQRTDFDAFNALLGILLRDPEKLGLMRTARVELDMVMMFLEITQRSKVYSGFNTDGVLGAHKPKLDQLLENCENTEAVSSLMNQDGFMEALAGFVEAIVQRGKARKIGKCIVAADTLACPQHLAPYGYEGQGHHHLTAAKLRDKIDGMLTATHAARYDGGIFD